MILILGASTGVGLKLALLSAQNGNDIILSSSSKEDLLPIKNHIESVYSVKVFIQEIDLSNIQKSIKNYKEKIKKFFPEISSVYFLSGKCIDDSRDIKLEEFKSIVDVNFTSLAYLLSEIIENIPFTSLIIFSSTVACIRARNCNTAYASAKKSMEFFITGLRHRYPKRSKYLKIVRFGYIDSPMTYGKTLLLPKASTLKTAHYLLNINKKTNFISYFPRWWRMFNFIKFIPFSIFKFFHF